jgi:hypothetical protein
MQMYSLLLLTVDFPDAASYHQMMNANGIGTK